jgi:hypothetical protein
VLIETRTPARRSRSRGCASIEEYTFKAMLEVGHTPREFRAPREARPLHCPRLLAPHGRYDPPRRSRRARPPVRSTRPRGPSALGPRRGLSIHVARLSRQCITSVMFAVRIDEARRHRAASVFFDPHGPLHVDRCRWGVRVDGRRQRPSAHRTPRAAIVVSVMRLRASRVVEGVVSDVLGQRP